MIGFKRHFRHEHDRRICHARGCKNTRQIDEVFCEYHKAVEEKLIREMMRSHNRSNKLHGGEAVFPGV